MKKKILLIISLCLIALGLAACGETDPTTMSYNGYSYDQLKSTCEGTVTSLLEMPDEQKEPYVVMKDMLRGTLTSSLLLPQRQKKTSQASFSRQT